MFFGKKLEYNVEGTLLILGGKGLWEMKLEKGSLSEARSQGMTLGATLGHLFVFR